MAIPTGKGVSFKTSGSIITKSKQNSKSVI